MFMRKSCSPDAVVGHPQIWDRGPAVLYIPFRELTPIWIQRMLPGGVRALRGVTYDEYVSNWPDRRRDIAKTLVFIIIPKELRLHAVNGRRHHGHVT